MRECVSTENWTLEQIARYGPEITAAMRKLVDRFPNDLTMNGMAEELFSGAQQLWLLLNDGKFEAFALTEIKTTSATGHKTVLLTAMAGEGGEDAVPFMEPIEAWAKTVGADDFRVVGRLGWRKALAKRGYKPVTTYYRKSLNEGAESAI